MRKVFAIMAGALKFQVQVATNREPGYLTGTDAKTAGCDTTLRTGLLDPPFNTPRLPLRLCRLRSSTWAPTPRTGATNAARSARDPRG